MASLGAPASPNSCQLRRRALLRSSPDSIRRVSPFFLRNIQLLHWRIRASSVAGNGNGNADGRSWMEPEKGSAESFSGWSESGSGSRKERQGRLGGIAAAGAAGVILTAGLALASLSLGKKSSAGIKAQMKPLTSQQEAILLSENRDEVDQAAKKCSSVTLDEKDELTGKSLSGSECDTALQVTPGKVVVPPTIDQVQGQALAALQVLKVIDSDVRPGDLCTRREYARWLVAASSALSRNSISKVYPAMYIENVTDLAFDDVTPQDPDFTSIQGLAEAGLISSKLSSEGEQDNFFFSPDSPLSRQDLVSWKMAIEKRQLPEVDKKTLYQQSGFIDIDRISPHAWPALMADISAGEHGITALAFGYTRLFQPDKPVTKAQAAIALAVGDAAEVVGEELARIEAESLADTAVTAHSALVAQIEKDLHAVFEKQLAMEREKIAAVEKLAEEATLELEKIKAERNEGNSLLLKGRAAVESEMEVLSKLRHEVEEQLQSLMSDRIKTSIEHDRLNKLRKEAEDESQAIIKLQYELEVERKALSMARAWAEDEAKRTREHAKALEEARYRWEQRGIKVIVDSELQDDAATELTWLNADAEKLSVGQSPVKETISQGENLVKKLEVMASEVKGKSFAAIKRIIEKIKFIIEHFKVQAAEATNKAREVKAAAVSTLKSSAEDLSQKTESSVASFSSTVKDGMKRLTEECKESMDRISQKFKM
ncbi:uncharacterized protein LOC116252718 isoform X6 [Nymphaea colorata]|uniref:uncharacterized protein LOC116252718 isoform X6 n=1 Tax=Nymphaea colorata TaxID=210225 RepID=UPI00129E99CE|nr:uncharacterized protein LOC116252718 isoform X6 [Nymphaea colorata]